MGRMNFDPVDTNEALIVDCKNVDTGDKVALMVPVGQVAVGDTIIVMFDQDNHLNLEVMEFFNARKEQ